MPTQYTSLLHDKTNPFSIHSLKPKTNIQNFQYFQATLIAPVAMVLVPNCAAVIRLTWRRISPQILFRFGRMLGRPHDLIVELR